MFILLKQIVDFSTAQCISLAQISSMRHTIFEYLELRVKLFPEVKLRPKHHYITHYPHLTKQFGPLIRFWTMRFESKHSFFKNVIRHTRNFKNVPKTFTERHQYLQALLSTNTSRFHETIILQHKNDARTLFTAEEKQLMAISNIEFTSYYLCDGVEYRGIAFKTFDIIYYKRGDFGEPIFSKIKFIFVEKRTSLVYFLCSVQEVFEFKEVGLIELVDSVNLNLFIQRASDFLDLTIHYKYSNKTEKKTYLCIKHALPY